MILSALYENPMLCDLNAMICYDVNDVKICLN